MTLWCCTFIINCLYNRYCDPVEQDPEEESHCRCGWLRLSLPSPLPQSHDGEDQTATQTRPWGENIMTRFVFAFNKLRSVIELYSGKSEIIWFCEPVRSWDSSNGVWLVELITLSVHFCWFFEVYTSPFHINHCPVSSTDVMLEVT